MFEREFPELRKATLKIFCVYGFEHRIINCIEELAELQKAYTKLLRWNIIVDFKLKDTTFNYQIKDLKEKIIEEMSDVYITMEETKYCIGISDEEIFKIMKEKINRGVR
jgi:hypothetical protein